MAPGSADRLGAWWTTGAHVAGDVTMTGTAGADVAPSAPGQAVIPATPGDDGEVAPDVAVLRPATPVTEDAPVPTHVPAAEHAPATTEDAPASADASGPPARAVFPAPSAAAPGTSGGAAVRRRLARLGAPRGGGVNPVLEPLIKTVRATHPKADIRLIERAYDVAAHWHADQKRKSGDPYITHPLAVATIPLAVGLDAMRQLAFVGGPAIGLLGPGSEAAILVAMTVGFSLVARGASRPPATRARERPEGGMQSGGTLLAGVACCNITSGAVEGGVGGGVAVGGDAKRRGGGGRIGCHDPILWAPGPGGPGPVRRSYGGRLGP